MTNYVTNYIVLSSTNVVPVSLVGTDYNTWLSLYFDGFANGWPLALSVTVCWLIYRSFRRTGFPSGD